MLAVVGVTLTGSLLNRKSSDFLHLMGSNGQTNETLSRNRRPYLCGYLVIDTLNSAAREVQLNKECNDMSSPLFANPYACKGRIDQTKVVKQLQKAWSDRAKQPPTPGSRKAHRVEVSGNQTDNGELRMSATHVALLQKGCQAG